MLVASPLAKVSVPNFKLMLNGGDKISSTLLAFPLVKHRIAIIVHFHHSILKFVVFFAPIFKQ
jgi:hypothetical protein